MLSSQTKAAENLAKEQLLVGYVHGQLEGVNPQDAEAAFKTLAKTLGIKSSYDVEITVKTYKSGVNFGKNFNQQIPHIILMSSWDYLINKESELIEPKFVPADKAHVMRRYLLVSKQVKSRNIEDLHGLSLNLIYSPSNTLARQWLNVALKEADQPDINSFFGSIEYHDDPMATVLPVFFGKRDAALVDAEKFALMVELNPQLQRLNIIASSKPFLNGLVCFKRDGWSSPEFRDAMIDTLANLHKTSAGQQILTIFKTGQTVPYKAHYLESVQDLKNKTQLLAKQPTHGDKSSS